VERRIKLIYFSIALAVFAIFAPACSIGNNHHSGEPVKMPDTSPLPDTHSRVGIFDEFGMIWNAYTPIDQFLRDMDIPCTFNGTPGKLENMQVANGAVSWNSPDLLDRFIYLPSSMFDGK